MDSVGNEFFEIKSNPKVKQLDAAIKEFRYIGALLGLDPADRAKLKAEKAPEKDPIEDFLNRKLTVVK